MVLPNSKIAAWLARAGRGRHRVDPPRHQGDGVLPGALRRRLPGDARQLPRDLSGRRLPADDPLQPPGRVPAQGRGRRLPREPERHPAVESGDQAGDGRRGLARLDQRREPGADHQGHQRRPRRAAHHAARAEARRRRRTTTSSAAATSSPTRRSTCRSRRPGSILNESQKGLSGVETHARLSITHYKGKTEVAAVTNEPIPGVAGHRERRA